MAPMAAAAVKVMAEPVGGAGERVATGMQAMAAAAVVSKAVTLAADSKVDRSAAEVQQAEALPEGVSMAALAESQRSPRPTGASATHQWSRRSDSCWG